MQDVITRKSRRDLIAGLIFIAIATGFAIEAMNYEMGSALRMGPGFMPLTLAGILAILGVVTVVVGLSEHEMVEITPVPWVAMGLILASLAIFGMFARQLGLVPVVFLCTALAAFGSRNTNLISALIIAACMTALCYVIFKLGLGVTLPTFGPLMAF